MYRSWIHCAFIYLGDIVTSPLLFRKASIDLKSNSSIGACNTC